MTQKQKRFIEELISNGGNATEAAARVYDCKNRQTAEAIGMENLRKPLLSAEIEKRRAEVHEKLQERTIVTREWVIAGLVENFQRAMTAVPVLDNKGIETGEYRYRGDVANRALELMGKDIGMFADILKLKQSFEAMSDADLHATAASLLGGDNAQGEGEDSAP